jgi:hypothetical protein
MTKGTTTPWSMDFFSLRYYEKNWLIKWRKIGLGQYLTPHANVGSRWITVINVT